MPDAKMLANRTFGLIFSAIFFVVGIYPLVIHDLSPRLWALLIALVLICTAFLKPTWLLPLNKAWMKFGLLMHSIINPILMGIIFFTSVMPTGLLRRLFRRDSLKLKFDPNADSYWVERETSIDPEFFDNQF